MSLTSSRPKRPSIVLSQTDHDTLARLAARGLGRGATASDELFFELARARIVPDHRVSPDVVRMGSTLTFRTDTGQERVVTLVPPDEADIAQGRISVLTPVGAALIGLSEGQSIDWTARDGRVQHLEVVRVQPVRANPDVGEAPRCSSTDSSTRVRCR
jgi:regulator of nucleoside diphosphate kinase